MTVPKKVCFVIVDYNGFEMLGAVTKSIVAIELTQEQMNKLMVGNGQTIITECYCEFPNPIERMKTKFDLENFMSMDEQKLVAYVTIHDPGLSMHPHVTFTVSQNEKHSQSPESINATASMRDSDLEEFAVNILKAIGSKKLKG